MIRACLKSLALGVGAAVLVVAMWLSVGERLAGVTSTRPASQNAARPADAPVRAAPDDITVTTTDAIVQTTTYSDPYVAWIALATVVGTSAWNLRRLRRRGRT